jgi:hypothetical protein
MNMLSYLPGISLTLTVAFMVGLLTRLVLEGANFKIAMISTTRFLFMPLAIISVINDIHSRRRRILFDAKKSGEFDDKTLVYMEFVFDSKKELAWVFLKVILKMYRPLMDLYIKTSIKYEQERAKKSKKKKKKDEKKFYEIFLNESDVSNQLFHRR